MSILSQHAQMVANLLGLRAQKLVELHEPIKAALLFFEKDGGPDSAYTKFVDSKGLSVHEQALLVLGLLPHVQADMLDSLLAKTGTHLPLGGVRGRNHRGFLPTGETALFLLAGDDKDVQPETRKMLAKNHLFYKERILWLEEVPEGEPALSGRIIVNPDYVELFTTGETTEPEFSLQFPAHRVRVSLDWDDLVLPSETMYQIAELTTWLRHHRTLMDDWGMVKTLKPGYRVLFHGPSGTGKTLTAGLLGKENGLPVYRIDLSMVVSKYIGETEKNLANLFARAEGKNWILFFDEADALFGKRTGVRDAHDKYANQEVSYLLQRVEDYNGLVILASNFKSNIDEAFVRRFQSIIHFPLPSPAERLCLWQKAFPAKAMLESNIDYMQLAQKYELTGANIMNIVQYCCLQALGRAYPLITSTDIEKGVLREYAKEERLAP